MTRSYRFSILVLGLAAVTAALLPFSRPPVGERRFDAPDAAMQYHEARRIPAGFSGSTARLYDRALERLDRVTRFSSRAGRSLPLGQHATTAALDAWTPLGPGNIGGRTRIVRYHPTAPHILFAAGVSGGIWKSDDNGITWRPTAEGLANIAVNSFVIDPVAPDVMYAGTGEGYFREEIRGTGLPLRGSGIFISLDGSTTWKRLAGTDTADFHWVNDLELGTGSQSLYAATRTGVWRTSDRGESWRQLLTTRVRGGCLDLAIRQDGPDDVVFASCGSYEQATVYRVERANSEPRIEAVLSEPAMGRTSLAIAPSNRNVIYALAASNDPGPGDLYRQGLLAVYRSEAGGAPGSWVATVTNAHSTPLYTFLLTNVNTALNCDGTVRPANVPMGWYNNVIAVDPADENRVWAAGVDWFRSDDGGRTWGVASTPRIGGPWQMHVDQHGMTFHPQYDGAGNQTLIVGNDGGIYRTSNARAPVMAAHLAPCNPAAIQVRWEPLNRGYAVTQFYHGLPFPDGNRYLGGTQDNGTVFGSDENGLDGWRTILGGDGGHVAIDPANPDVIYAESQFGRLARSTTAGQQWLSATNGLDPDRYDLLGPDANFLFITPFVMDPVNSRRLWLGGEFIYRTVNGAESWQKASTVLADGALVSALAVAPGTPDFVAAGTTKGDILSTRQALGATVLTNWMATRPRDGWITSLAFDPSNANTIYATYGSFGGPHVYRSQDGGASWHAIDGTGDFTLPDMPVHSIVVDPDDGALVYLGTDLGVWVSTDGGQRWMVESTGFGPVVTEWIALIVDTSGRKRLFAFTHGRGVWRADIR